MGLLSDRQPGHPEKYLSVYHLRHGLEMRAIKGAGFTISSQVINYGVQTVGTIVLARLLSPDLFGLVAMVETLSLLLQNFGFNGITEAVVQRPDVTQAEMSKLFWVYMFIMLASTAGFMAASPLIVWFFNEPQLKSITMVMALTILFGGLSACHLSLLTRNMEFHVIAAIQILAAFLSTAAAIVIAVKGFGYWALVLRRVSMQFFVAVFAWIFCRWRPGGLVREARIGPILRFTFRTYATYLIDYVRKSADKILIGKILGKTILGHYDRAYQLAAVLPNQLTASLSGVSLAALSRLRDDRDNYIRLFSKSLSLIAFIAFPMSVLLTLVGKNLIVFLLGPQWDEAGKIFSALGPSVGVVVIYYSIYWLHFSLGRADRLLRWSTFTLVVSLLAYALGILFGPVGVAVAYSILFYLLLIPALSFAGKPLNLRADFYISILWKYWLAAFLAAGVYGGLLYYMRFISDIYGHLGPMGKILFSGATYLGFYLAITILFFGGLSPLVSLHSVVRKFFSRSQQRG